MQMLLNGGNRQNTLMGTLQLQSCLLRLDGTRLDEKDAGDDLQAVGDPVLLSSNSMSFSRNNSTTCRSMVRRSVMSKWWKVPLLAVSRQKRSERPLHSKIKELSAVLCVLLSTPERNGPDGDHAPGIERTIDHA
jgi:hypothetical protein